MVCADFYADFYGMIHRAIYSVKFSINLGFIYGIAIFPGMAGTGV
jgi:hypothetical protein